MAILEAESTITLMENPLNGFKIQLEPAEERICETKDRATEMIQSEILVKKI